MMENSVYQILQEWHELVKSGVITEAEFIQKKKELLGEKQEEPEIVTLPENNKPPEVAIPLPQISEEKVSSPPEIPNNTPPLNDDFTEEELPKNKSWLHKNKAWVIGLPVLAVVCVAGWLLFMKQVKPDPNIQTIKSFIAAEQSRNFNAIYSFFSPNIIRYWNLYNPSERQLENSYEHYWRITPYSENHIIKIQKVDDATYDLYTNFSIENSRGKFKTITSRVRFIFNPNGKIIENFGM